MITTAIYSHRTSNARTATDLGGLALWVLSVRNARRHFERLALVTDQHGHDLLVDGLGLPFDEVSITLDDCEPEHPRIWSLGKLHAYAEWAARGVPFIHLDHDAILWKPLPQRILAAEVCALMPEPQWRFPKAYESKFLANLPVMPTSVHAMLARSDAYAFNTGVFGGSNCGFIADYAEAVLANLHEPANTLFWSQAHGSTASIWLEQFWLAAFAAEAGQYVETLVEVREHDDPTGYRYHELGFTHLLGDSKREAHYLRRILRRCETDFPADFARCLALAH